MKNMPRPYKKSSKEEERKEFVEVMENHIVGIDNTINTATNKNALYYEERRDIHQAVKRLKEVITRIR